MHTQTQFSNLQALLEPESYKAATIARDELREAGGLTPFLDDLLTSIEARLGDHSLQIPRRVEELLRLERKLHAAQAAAQPAEKVDAS